MSTCGYPGEPDGGMLLGGDKNLFIDGKEVRYKCEEGFIMTGPGYRTCQKNGIWSGSLPLCSKIDNFMIIISFFKKTSII